MTRLALALSLALLPSCISIHTDGDGYALSSHSASLSKNELTDGGTVVHKLHGSLSSPKILSTETRSIDRARFGIVTKLLDPELAERTGVEAFAGVWIAEVKPNSAARRAGLVEGDVLRSVDGVAVTSPEQLGGLVESRLTPGVPVEVTFDRWSSDGDKTWLTRKVVELTPDAETKVESSTETTVLDANDRYVALTGLGVAEVSGETARAIWGDPMSRWIVTDVRNGSPAYRSGLRLGDVVKTVDGRPPSGATVMNDALAARVIGKRIDTAATSALVVSDTELAGRTDPIGFTVDGPLGRHTADVRVVDDLDDEVDIYVPILFDYESDVTGTEWSFLDFIFQFGANYESRYHRSATRAPAKHTKWSAFPFGLFEYDSNPHRTIWTLLWFIDIRTS